MAQLLQVYSGRLELRWKFIKENKKVRKQELDQESDQEKKESFFLVIEIFPHLKPPLLYLGDNGGSDDCGCDADRWCFWRETNDRNRLGPRDRQQCLMHDRRRRCSGRDCCCSNARCCSRWSHDRRCCCLWCDRYCCRWSNDRWRKIF